MAKKRKLAEVQQAEAPGVVPNGPFLHGPPAMYFTQVMHEERMRRVDEVAVAMYQRALGDGRSITTCSVLNDTLFQLGVYSLEAIGMQLQLVPCLRTLAGIEGKVNAYFVSYVAGTRICTLHDLVTGLCKEENVSCFEDLGLGPLLLHPLVAQFFSAGLTKVHRITAIEVLDNLLRLLDRTRRVDEAALLSFIAENRGLADPKNLCVRIRSIGMYVGISIGLKNKQKEAMKKWESETLKLQYQEARSSVLKTMKLSSTPNQAKVQKLKKTPTHTRFLYSDSDSECANEPVTPRFSTCPFPSAAEEQGRAAGGKEYDFSISSAALNEFVGNWKMHCQGRPVGKVLRRMLASVSDKSTKDKVSEIFHLSPARELLNFAIASMNDVVVTCAPDIKKGGYDLEPCQVMEFVEQWRETCKASSSTTEAIEQILASGKRKFRKKMQKYIELLQSYPAVEIFNVAIKSMKDGWSFPANTGTGLSKPDAALVVAGENTSMEKFEPDAILTVTKRYFNEYVPETPVEGKEWIGVLKFIIDCEKHLRAAFSEGVFTKLGCNGLLDYMERNITEFGGRLNGGFKKIEVPRRRLASFVRQAQNAGALSQEEVLARLLQQFQMTGLDLEDIMEASKESWAIKVHYSAALFETGGRLTDRNSIQVGKLGSVADSDAERCLAKAPMLFDLELWSQWTTVFQPQLGPLLDWLEREGAFTVLVTKAAGGVVKIDEEAKPEKFMIAITEGRPQDVALQLVSLVVLHGGSRNAPKELLKSHASTGIKVFSEMESDGFKRLKDDGQDSPGNARLARFVLNCLAEVPHEFCEFAMEIFYPAFANLVFDAADVLLESCNSVSDHLLLHRIGLALGVSEWIKDYSSYEVTRADNGWSVSAVGVKVRTRQASPDDELRVCKRQRTDSLQPESASFVNSCVPQSQSVTNEAVIVSEGMLESEARQLIQKIRREEFGLEDGFECADSQLLDRQHARMGRALQCLSQNLYSEDCHFILELVQNADDNKYAPEAHPTLVFFIQPERVVVLNNEIGFTAKNMQALCDVGNSTKLGQPAGYIGHKGIGFKSVFRVTDSPMIHSNGFHVKFDISKSSLGFILPTWVSSPLDGVYLDHILLQASGGSTSAASTRIDLPLRSSLMEATGSKTISGMFRDLQPKLLLFLHKLRTLVVKDEISDSFRVMSRLEVGTNIVKLTDGEKKGTFLVVQQQLQAPVVRSGIQSTELALAFELKEVQNGLYASNPTLQDVFSFLPVRSYGLKFIVQGDFILPSSREDLDRDSPWNQWLRSEIPKLFLQTLNFFTSSGAFGSRLEAITSYMSYVPVEGEVLGFFSSVPRIILSQLRAAPCLPVQDSETLALPCTVLRGWSGEVRSLVSDQVLHQCLGLYYLDKRVVISDVLASSLGVARYGVATLVRILKALGSKVETFGVEWLRSYLKQVYRSMLSEKQAASLYRQEDHSLKELYVVKFIPLSSGVFTSLESGAVWLLDSSEAIKQHPSKRFGALYSNIRTVDPALLNEDEAGIIKDILLKVGVKVASPHDIIKNHVLSAMCSMECLVKDEVLVVEYLAYCMLHFEWDSCRRCENEKSELMSELKRAAVMLTDKGLRRVSEHRIHFSTEFGNAVDMRKVLHGTDVLWYEVDPAYLQFTQSTKLWRKFFTEIGVSDFVKVHSSELRVPNKKATIWRNEDWNGVEDGASWDVRDWESPELVDILNALSRRGDNPGKSESCRLLLSAFDTLWDEQYDQYSKASFTAEGTSKGGECNASFVLHMRQFSWINNSVDDRLCSPTVLFHRTKEVEDLLGCSACYVEPQVQSAKLARALGLRTEASIVDVRLLLKRSEHEPASLNQMEKAYRFLSEKMDPKACPCFFASPHIFVPSLAVKKRKKPVHGKLYPSSQVVWEDPFRFEDCLRELSIRTLSQVYPGLEEFFVEKVRVLKVPDFDGYISILTQVSSSCSPSTIIEKVLKLFARWSEELETDKLKAPEVKRALQDAAVFPTTQNTWTGLNNPSVTVCWCDDPTLAHEFDENDLKSVVQFVDVGGQEELGVSKKRESLSTLLEAVCLPRFSEIVGRHPIVYGTSRSSELEGVISRVIPYAQRYMLQHHADMYESLVESDAYVHIQGLQCVVVDQLFQQYSLCHGQVQSRSRTECDCLIQGYVLYVSFSHTRNYASIFSELSKIFFGGKTDAHLVNFLHLITLQSMADGEMEVVASSQGLVPLPAEQVPWQLGAQSDNSTNKTVLCAETILERQRSKTLTQSFKTVPAERRISLDVSQLKSNEEHVDAVGWASKLPQRDTLHTQPASQGQQDTGRQGEEFVFRHLCKKYGSEARVTWINQTAEMGRAYDILVERANGVEEYVEVKSTRSNDKNWFEISPWEWEFASKMGSRYSIIRIFLLENHQQARLMVLDNPLQLCRDKLLQLALIVPKKI